MPFKPQNTSPGNWLGYKKVAVKRIEDKREVNEELQKLDIAIEIILDVEGTKYDQALSLFGNFEWEDETSIKDCPLLKAIYNFFDAIGFKGGVNLQGIWVNENDNKIDDIISYINTNVLNYNEDNPDYNWVTYLYPELSKKNGKVYTQAWRKIVKNNEKDINDYVSYVNWCISKGFLKEANQQTTDNVHIKPAGLATMD